ncbi:MAG: transglutaminase family protein [Solirubrobacterales bacterium]
MSSTAGAIPADVAGAVARGAGRARTASRPAGRATMVAAELAVFAGLAAIGLAQCSRLVVGSPFGRLLAALGVVLVGAAALSALAARVSTPSALRVMAAITALVTLCASLVVVGLPARLLLPAQWGEFGSDLHRGIAGLEHTDAPYRGHDEWVQLTAMLGATALVALAATVAFWPAGRRRRSRIVGLALVVTLFGFATTLYPPAGELLWGALLLVLIVLWLWLPRLTAGQAPVAIASAGLAALVALPIAGRLGDSAWWDWQNWNLFARERTVRFDWDHSYGPLEWPQRGTSLLTVHSAQSHYWKVTNLDRFDGFKWERAQPDDILAADELTARRNPLGADLARRHPEWVAEPDFKLDALNSDLVVGAGETQTVKNIATAQLADDGTATVGSTPISRGDEYSAVIYDPHPSPEQLRHAPQHYPSRATGSTLVGLPRATLPRTPGGDIDPSYYEAPSAISLAPVPSWPIPTWGNPLGPARAAIKRSAYLEVWQLARHLTARADTVYDAVAKIERYLRHGPYRYNSQVHNYVYPLPAFLFVDRQGYCQQFSGAMALMLRLLGIPTRVATGFAPGQLDPQSGDYDVRDLDAHSWVEVFFPKVGWVTFDPTPAAAPALTQGADALGHPTINSATIDSADPQSKLRGSKAAATATAAGLGGEGGGPWGAIALGVVALFGLVSAAASAVAVRRREALRRGELAEAQISELTGALERLGWPLPRRLTLRELERRFAAGGRSAVARYAAGLREHRFAAATVRPPGPGARRALRRSLTAGGGLAKRLRALLLIPPGGPRSSR